MKDALRAMTAGSFVELLENTCNSSGLGLKNIVCTNIFDRFARLE